MDANEHRATPGYVYGVAIHSSRQEEGTPPCACPCHLANSPRGARGWYCNLCYAFSLRVSYPEEDKVAYTHEQAIVDGTSSPRKYMVMVPDYYFLTKGNNLNDAFPKRHFKTSAAAEKAADRMNRDDVLASLNLTPLALARRERLKKLGHSFGMSYGDGHPETRLPREPGRYAVEEWSDRYSESFWDTHHTLEKVREVIEEGDVMQVVDLDTGKEIPYTVTVEIGSEREPAQAGP